MSAESRSLVERLKARDARAAVIGLGYVGLPLAVEFAKAGFDGHRLSTSTQRKVDGDQRAAQSYIPDVADSRRAAVRRRPARLARHDRSRGAGRRRRHQHLRADAAAQDQGPRSVLHRRTRSRSSPSTCRPGQLVILESTTYPGTTDEVVQPRSRQAGWWPARDFFLAFSPERVDPGNPHFHTRNIPKVVGGVNDASTEAARGALRQHRRHHRARVSSTRVAEMVKLLENTFRAVNIGLVNELALMCDRWASTSGR